MIARRGRLARAGMTMRIISGKFRGRPLRSLHGLDLRPTSDRLRETLFDVLTGGEPERLMGTTWLDLFAGTGAVGIEALSRGASAVHFVEASKKAAALIHANLKSLGITGGFEVLTLDAAAGLHRLEARGVVCDFCFLDPPYRMQEAYGETLEALSRSPLLNARSLVIAEHEKRFDPDDAFGALARYRTLKQGDAALSFYKLSS
jgi:16S rRNA (guanine966-N2)-methyltransferase